MWKLNTIKATNLCAFRELEYSIQQHQTTLIFGNNLDNDSQVSNGSGKSALIETIAIGLTGDPLRNVKRDEIINDAADEAFVSILLTNDMSEDSFLIERTLSRKNPQIIEVYNIDGQGNKTQNVQASVNDYNKYILEVIGLSKDEIYSYFVLSKHKFTSFLSSSDKEKKEIINRFSNGILVDESLEVLSADIAAKKEMVSSAERNVSSASGKLSAIKEQIASEIAESTEKSQTKAKRIEELNAKIASKQEYIHSQERQITTTKGLLNQLFDIEEDIVSLEESKPTLEKAQQAINYLFSQANLPAIRNYFDEVQDMQDKFGALEASFDDIMAQCTAKQAEIETTLTEALSSLKVRSDKFMGSYETENKAIQNSLSSLSEEVSVLQKTYQDITRQDLSCKREINSLKAQLAGIIQCPKCHHEFVLASDINVNEVRATIKQLEADLVALAKEQQDNLAQQDIITNKEAEYRKQQRTLQQQKQEILSELNKAQEAVLAANTDLSVLKTKMANIESKMATITGKISQASLAMYDDAYATLDTAIKNKENQIKNIEIDIQNCQGHIESYLESIEEIENATYSDLLERLKESQSKYEIELDKCMAAQEIVERQLADYQKQESLFVEFKTHLANTKINDLSRITNEFLERIGSDIRISFSGYTVLKSGKVRDKISISLIRDGIDCGSFDKFSEGEKARVNLANILAMNKLTNINCLDNKGLDLLVLDEILDATDETGLSNIFEALNNLKITALVVSHGNIAENYPHKIIISKQNGISFLNENA